MFPTPLDSPAPVLIAVAPFVGSFLGVLVQRIEDGRPIVFGRSECDSCHHRLAPRDLVPLLSWMALRGRCRFCGARLGWFYPAIELAAVVPVVWAAFVVSGWWLLAASALGWLLLALATIDWRIYRLPDVLTAALFVLGLDATAWLAPWDLTDHLLGAVIGLTVFVLFGFAYRALRHRDGVGLGDAKLLGALGMWVGWQGLPEIVLAASLFALLAVLAQAFVGRSISATTRVPLGTFLAAAGWLIWLYGPYFQLSTI